MSEDRAVKAFGDRLRDAMRRKGLTSVRNKSGCDVAGLAKATGLSYEMARRYVQGEAMPRPDALDAISAYVGASTSWLAYGVENRAVLDSGALERCMLAVTEAQQLSGISLSARQLSRVVAQLYQEVSVGEKPSAKSLAAALKALVGSEEK